MRILILVLTLLHSYQYVAAQDPPLTHLQKREAAYQWHKQDAVRVFEESARKDAPWAPQALDLIDDACKWFVRMPGAPRASEIAQKGRPLVESGCDDPLVLAVYGMALDDIKQDAAALQPLRQGVHGLQRTSHHPLWLATASTMLAQHEQARSLPEAGESFGVAIDATTKALCRSSPDPVIREHLAGRLGDLPARGLGPSMCEGIVSLSMDDPTTDPWLRDIFEASALIDRGWKARGAGFVNTVTASGASEFERCLKLATERLESAMKAVPNSPQAASRMIGIAMAGFTPKDQGLGFWFDRTTEIQFDFQPAYDHMINALRPRWGYSYEDLLGFGAYCASTKRYDTRVPFYMVEAILQLCNDTRDFQRVWEIQNAYPLVAEALKGLISHQANAPFEVADRTTLACAACLAGEFDDAREQVGILGDRWDNETGRAFKLTRVEALELIATYTSSTRDVLLGARKAFTAGEWDRARDLYSEGLAKLQPTEQAAREGASEWLAIATSKATLERGEWVNVTWDDKGYGWFGEAGSWKPIDANRIRGTPGPGNSLLLLNRTPVGSAWEIQGIIDFVDAEPNGKFNGGIIWGYERIQSSSARWRSWLMQLDAGNAVARIGFVGRAGQEIAAPAPITPRDNRFSVQLRGRHLTVRIGDNVTFEGQLPRSPDGWIEGDQIGFGAFNTAGPVEFSNIRFRKLSNPREDPGQP